MRPDAAPIQLGLDAFEQVLGVRPLLVRSGGTLPIVPALEAKGIPTIITGFGTPESNVHSPNERILYRYFDQGIDTAAGCTPSSASSAADDPRELLAEPAEVVLQIPEAGGLHAVRLRRVDPLPQLLDLVEERGNELRSADGKLVCDGCHHAALPSSSSAGSSTGRRAGTWAGRMKATVIVAPATRSPRRTNSATR